MFNSTEDPPADMYVVLDTNVWVYSSDLLRAPLGASFLFWLRQASGVIGYPKVVDLEVRKHALKRLRGAVEQVHQGYASIRKLYGEHEEFQLPAEADLESAVDRRMEELNEFIDPVDFSINHAERALNRIIAEEGPGQFRDTAIWEAVLEIAQTHNVCFVTDDTDFFKGGDPEQGLGDSLQEDADEAPKKIKVFFRLNSFLEEVKQTAPSVNTEEAQKKIATEVAQRLDEIGNQSGGFEVLARIEPEEPDVEVFVTEDPSTLSASFNSKWLAAPVDVEKHDESWVLIANGSCSVDAGSYTVSNLTLDEVIVRAVSGHKIKTIKFLRTATSPRTVRPTVRRRLD